MASICATGESTLLAQAVAYRENSHTINSTSETPTSNTDENTSDSKTDSKTEADDAFLSSKNRTTIVFSVR